MEERDMVRDGDNNSSADIEVPGGSLCTKFVRYIYNTVLVIGMCAFVYYAYNVLFNVPVRAGVSMTSYVFRDSERQLQKFYRQHGMFPPVVSGSSSYYGLLDDSLTSPITIVDNTPAATTGSRKIYIGPPVDPFRRIPMFPKEVKKKARYQDGHNSEGPFCWFGGYAPRYYRSADGQYAILLGNGPDKDIDISKQQLDVLQDANKAHMMLSYDGTNGTGTSGDLYRVVEPPSPTTY